MALGNTLNILRPPGRSTPPIQTGWNADLVKNMHKVLGEMAQEITALGVPVAATGPTVIIKTADETVNNSTTLQDDDHLFFAMAADTAYTMQLILLLEVTSAQPDFSFAWTFPTGCTMFWHLLRNWNGATLTLRSETQARATTSSIGVTGFSIQGIIRNGSTAGTLQLQWAQDTLHASDCKVLKHSHMTIESLGAV